jgi:hypothetical protein
MASLPPMTRPAAILLLLMSLSGCISPKSHAPDFATKPFEPFNRQDTVAIALREWRLFGSPTDDDDAHPPQKPERAPGLWERVGEYWWVGLDADAAEVAWTGKHDAQGHVFPASVDGDYAWSAAFISYVMRIAGAGDRFPYSPNHATYVNAAAAQKTTILRAHPPQGYRPMLGDLVCRAREWAIHLRFSDLPTTYLWPGHCDIVVAVGPDRLALIGGNVRDEVHMNHLPLSDDGSLPERTGVLAILEVRYDAEAEPAADQ